MYTIHICVVLKKTYYMQPVDRCVALQSFGLSEDTFVLSLFINPDTIIYSTNWL